MKSPSDRDTRADSAPQAHANNTPSVIESDSALPSVAAHPAPWRLVGSGYVLAVSLPDDVLDHAAFVPDGWIAKRRGRIGTMMFVDYRQSSCGPYRELLVAPASFASDAGTFPAITRIFVSTYDSVVNGRNNWGIPKDRADFEVQRDPARQTELIRVSRDGHVFAELELRAYGPSLPVRSWLLPASLRTLVQPWQGKSYRLTLSASGKARLATVSRWKFDAEYFPDLTRGRVLAASYLPEFEMTFPVPEIRAL